MNLTHVMGRGHGLGQHLPIMPEHVGPVHDGVTNMVDFLGVPLLALWIMGAPLVGALISLALPAPRHNTIPHNRRRDTHVSRAPFADI